MFTAGADGSLRSWLLPKAGHMQPGISREKAHEGQRVTALAYHAGMVYTVSYDGMIKVRRGRAERTGSRPVSKETVTMDAACG